MLSRNFRQAARRFETMIGPRPPQPMYRQEGNQGQVAAVFLLKEDEKGEVHVVVEPPDK